MARHVRKGDTVYITSGSHRGKTGRIREILTKKDRVIVEGVNMVTKHQKPTRLNPQGGIITKEMPLHVSKVSPVVDGKPVRVGFRYEADGSKVRIARHQGKEVKVLGTVHGPRGEQAAAKKPAKKSRKKVSE